MNGQRDSEWDDPGAAYMIEAMPLVPTAQGEMRMKRIRAFFKNDEAIAVTEYGLLIALVAIALIAVVTIFGSQIAAWFATKTSQITTI